MDFFYLWLPRVKPLYYSYVKFSQYRPCESPLFPTFNSTLPQLIFLPTPVSRTKFSIWKCHSSTGFGRLGLLFSNHIKNVFNNKLNFVVLLKNNISDFLILLKSDVFLMEMICWFVIILQYLWKTNMKVYVEKWFLYYNITTVKHIKNHGIL